MKSPVIYIPRVFHNITLEQISAAITWEQRDAPRAEAYYAESDVAYTYGSGRGVRTYRPMTAWPTVLLDIRASICALTSERYELLFCNRYEDGHQHLGWHADDSPNIDHARSIPVVSFGANRPIYIRENGCGSTPQTILLEHGSLLLMRPGMQRTHQHRIPKTNYVCPPRVSLTYRGLYRAVEDISAAVAT